MTVTMDTSGNDPRIFFAAERTALAWNRTALTLMAFGFAIERFGLFLHMMAKDGRTEHHGPSFWFGLIFILLGCVSSFIAALQYKNILKSLRPGDIPPHANRYLAFVLNVVIAILAVAMLSYLLISDL